MRVSKQPATATAARQVRTPAAEVQDVNPTRVALEIVDALGGLSPQKQHAAALAIETLQRALQLFHSNRKTLAN